MSGLEALVGNQGADYWLTRWLLQRSLAGIYLVAFLVAANQFRPLLGSHGLTPMPFYLQDASFWRSPSLFVLHYSDGFAIALAWTGVACSILAVSGVSERFGSPVSAAIWGLMWLLYLSFVNVGQIWYSFGWETLLLESGFLAIFLGARDVAPPVIVIWLFRWVLFRLMFGAGLIKLRGDPCWRDLTCLVYHYQSQPIPNPLSWYLSKLPIVVHRAGVLFNHVTELVAPFGYLMPFRRVRYAAGIVTIAFQGMLILSGNLSWLNWLTIVIAVSCFDDVALSRVLPVHAGALQPLAIPHQLAAAALALVVGFLSIAPVLNMLSSGQMMNASFEPLHLVNTYGAFGSVSRRRLEVVLEGTADTVTTPATEWKEYEFKAKPGSVARRPGVVAPYHLRLDWLIWFAGLSRDYAEPWLLPLVARLLQNDKPTLGLIAANPFADRAPARIRARLYDYRFTTADERRATGDWWVRTLVGEYLPPVSLDSPGLLDTLKGQGWVY
ncbi:MAG: lipase maturation factor family protein [Gemmatimonadales bacterium]